MLYSFEMRLEEAIATLSSLKSNVLRVREFLVEYDKVFDVELTKIHRDHIQTLKDAHKAIFDVIGDQMRRVSITEIDDHIIDHRPLKKGE